jgi:Mlc titration factor MtfA (ptsG expression regulator)
VLDPYGAEDPAEFFAVATETFFERAVELAQRHPRLYEQLRRFYRQDPAVWPREPA